METAKRLLILVCFASTGYIDSPAQNMTPKIVQSYDFMQRVASANQRNLIDVGQQIPIFPMGQGKKVTEVVIDEAWKISSMTLYGSEKLVEGYRVRYDLMANAIDFKMPDQIKVMDAKRVKTLIWLDSTSNIPHYFVNGKDLRFDGVPSTSLVELVCEGKLNLYKMYTYWVKKADYNPALNVGNIDEKIYIEARFYYGPGPDLKLVPGKKKEFPAIFGDKADNVKAYMKEHDLSPSKEAELSRVFDYYNTLP